MSVTVYCDIETTSLRKDCDIIQIAAVCENEKNNQYILPTQPVSQSASEVTGLTVRNNIMFHNEKPMESESLMTALVLFLAWLQLRDNRILIGHSFRKFDLPRIIRAFEICRLLSSFQESMVGSVDTLPLCRSLYPDLECYRQEYLVTKFVNYQYSANIALADGKPSSIGSTY